MPEPIQGMVLFSDDVRSELGDKTSVMGLLGSDVAIRGTDEATVNCLLLFWAKPGEYTISGEIRVDGAPSEFKRPPLLKLSVKVPSDGPSQLIQIVANLKNIPIGSDPLQITVDALVNDWSISGAIRMTKEATDHTMVPKTSSKMRAREKPQKGSSAKAAPARKR